MLDEWEVRLNAIIPSLHSFTTSCHYYLTNLFFLSNLCQIGQYLFLVMEYLMSKTQHHMYFHAIIGKLHQLNPLMVCGCYSIHFACSPTSPCSIHKTCVALTNLQWNICKNCIKNWISTNLGIVMGSTLSFICVHYWVWSTLITFEERISSFFNVCLYDLSNELIFFGLYNIFLANVPHYKNVAHSKS